MKLFVSFVVLTTLILQTFAHPSSSSSTNEDSTYTDILSRKDLVLRMREMLKKRFAEEDSMSNYQAYTSSSEDQIPDDLLTDIRQTVSPNQMSNIRSACRRCFAVGQGRRRLCIRALTIKTAMERAARRGNEANEAMYGEMYERVKGRMERLFGEEVVTNGFECTGSNGDAAPSQAPRPNCPERRSRINECKSVEQNAQALFLVMEKKLGERISDPIINANGPMLVNNGRATRLIFDFKKNGFNPAIIATLNVLVRSNFHEFSDVFAGASEWSIQNKRIENNSGGRKIRYIVTVPFLSSYLSSQ